MQMKILVVHDVFRERGGGERIGQKFLEVFAKADLATLYWDPNTFEGSELENAVQAPATENPVLKRAPETLRVLFYPYLARRINTSGYDLVLSSGAWVMGVETAPEQPHIAYVHTPLRFAWDSYHLERQNFLKNFFASFIRSWESACSSNPDFVVANSENVRKRIKECYGRDADVIYPPVDTEKYYTDESRGYFLIVSRLNPKKKVLEVARAFESIDEKLIIAGEGSQAEAIKEISENNENIEYLGWVDEKEKISLYAECEALIFPAYDEDFGITPVEANASGKPVVAVNQGGVLETQNEDTAVFFENWSEKEIIDAIRRYNDRKDSFNPRKLQNNAEKFSFDAFKNSLREVVRNSIQDR